MLEGRTWLKMAGERKDTFDRCLVQQERLETKRVVADKTDLRGDEEGPQSPRIQARNQSEAALKC